ncbi:hypothetical protein [Cellulophaga sp. BC115SP]|uniref:hypothetical protein n=1 Tax=Cellulophaga sp. BC115SP TaxID=2683263 RepID=UPI001412ED3E|nr:hypothetical protein [Cellulophaga sp. BC115SP]NBB29228.1 hypothetical protein [Cellulophaga sp. BC115SP]
MSKQQIRVLMIPTNSYEAQYISEKEQVADSVAVVHLFDQKDVILEDNENSLSKYITIHIPSHLIINNIDTSIVNTGRSIKSIKDGKESTIEEYEISLERATPVYFIVYKDAKPERVISLFIKDCFDQNGLFIKDSVLKENAISSLNLSISKPPHRGTRDIILP